MRNQVFNQQIHLAAQQDFNPEPLFGCGQCFRWDKQPDGSWFGIAMGRTLTLRTTSEGVWLDCAEDEYRSIWEKYFDLGRDYAEIRRKLSEDSFGSKAAEFGAGLRILRQEPWETLCTFIFSQCNNIGRIKGIVDRFCREFGTRIDSGAQEAEAYAFPDAAVVASLDARALAPLRAGYRTEYLLSAARDVATGKLDLDQLSLLDTPELLRQLTALRGVGEKVAHCVALFGFGKTDAFPIDVWIRRALVQYYGGQFDPTRFGPDAGIIQQYLFHYIRNGIKAVEGTDGISD